MGYYDDKFEIKGMNMILDETVEIGEIVEEESTTYVTVYDRDKVRPFQQIREGFIPFWSVSRNSRSKLTERA